MNFDENYKVKLYLKIKDYEQVKKRIKYIETKDEEYLKLIKSTENFEIFKLLLKKFDFKAYSLFDVSKSKLLENKFALPFIKKDLIKNIKNFTFDFSNFKKPEDSNCNSVITNIALYNNLKFIKIYENFLDFFLNNLEFNNNLNNNFDINNKSLIQKNFFLEKNDTGETSSQIILKSDPTNVNGNLLEKFETALKYVTPENSYLFKEENDKFKSENGAEHIYTNNRKNDNEIVKKIIEKIINEPELSLKNNLADIEFKLLKLNLKLRKMYEFEPLYLKRNNLEIKFNIIHDQILNDLILNRIVLDKI